MSRTTKILFLLLALSVVGMGVHAAITTTNLGDGTTRLRADYLIPTPQVADVRDDICRGIGWTPLVTCTQPMVTAGQCTSGQVGTQVTNPETCIAAIDRSLRTHLRNLRRAGELKELEDAVVAPARNADKSGDLQ
jgi:hypothetical protein